MQTEEWRAAVGGGLLQGCRVRGLGRGRAAGLGGGLGLEEGVRLGLEGLAGEGGSGGREGKTLQALGGSSRDFWDAEAVKTCRDFSLSVFGLELRRVFWVLGPRGN